MGGKYKPGRYRRMSPEQREKAKRVSAEWARRHHRRRKIHMATHKLKRFAKGGPSASGVELLQLWKSQKGRCALTNVPITFNQAHIDHVVPNSRGGVQTIDNLRWTHPMANAAKGTRTDKEFWAWLDAIQLHYDKR